MYNIAIILTGDIRKQSSAYSKMSEVFKEFDVFCGSYEKHSDYIKKIGKTNNYVLINPEDIRFPHNIKKDDYQQNMLQWLHMDNIIKKYNNNLIKYDVIFKFRFDTLIQNCEDYYQYLQNLCKNIVPDTIYCDSDRVFGGDASTFLKAFTNFYDVIISETHINKGQNEENCFSKSWKSEPAFAYNLKKKKIKIEYLGFSAPILRGNYPKTHADGNKKLYENGKLLGKFQ